MSLPSTLKAEVKLTTGTGVSVASRELDALAPVGPDELGVLAVLFWCEEREVAGRWILADAALLPGRSAETVSFTRGSFVASAKAQRHLDALRRHVDENWPAFLNAFEDAASDGHEALTAALAAAHRDGKLRERFPADPILDFEHRAAVGRLIERHGESNAGRLLQDLLAYLVGLAGYRSVLNNPVGVPDFVVSGLHEHAAVLPAATIGGAPPAGEQDVVIQLTRDEIDRVVAHCRTAGDNELARVVARQTGTADARYLGRSPRVAMNVGK
jgi:hypothetical protein